MKTVGDTKTNGRLQGRYIRNTISIVTAMQTHFLVMVRWIQYRQMNQKADKYIYDPENPVKTIGSMGPYDQRSVETRNDVLIYDTNPLWKMLK